MGTAYIIGNGPSRKSVRREKLGQGAVYAANMRGMEMQPDVLHVNDAWICLLYTSPSPRDRTRSRMPSSA